MDCHPGAQKYSCKAAPYDIENCPIAFYSVTKDHPCFVVQARHRKGVDGGGLDKEQKIESRIHVWGYSNLIL
jgi:hypothetical protein